MLTQDRLKELLSYSPDTGLFTWASRPTNSIKVGDPAGCLDKSTGYFVIRVDKVLHYAHRLAYLYMTGMLPDGEIDHKDRDRVNNKWVNLRIASSSDNKANSSIRIDNTSGSKGVYKHKKNNKWVANAYSNGKTVYLGSYDCQEEASAAYMQYMTDKFGEYASDGR